jgi:hypothetical protein
MEWNCRQTDQIPVQIITLSSIFQMTLIVSFAFSFELHSIFAKLLSLSILHTLHDVSPFMELETFLIHLSSPAHN